MPEPATPKWRLHPKNQTSIDKSQVLSSPSPHAYAELAVTSNFTFLTGASHPDELVQQAARLGHRAVAITDCNSLAGVVRAHVAAKEIGVPLVVGCRLQFTEPQGLSILVYPTDRQAYGRLCRLLTLGKRRAPKGQCHLTLHDLMDHHAGLLAVAIAPRVLDQAFVEIMQGLKCHIFGDRLSLACWQLGGFDDQTRLRQLAAFSRYVDVPLVAINDVHYHHPSRRPLQDVITCIRHGCTLDQAGYRLFANAERYLKPPAAMARLFAEYPEAIARTVEIAQWASGFSLDELRYQYPDEVVPAGMTPMQHLIDLTWQGASKRYPHGVPAKVQDQIKHEFRLIDELNYAPYFLTVYDLVQFAQQKGILCQGRGAAANSAVCYCLGVTAVDPDRIDMLFERFLSKERNEPPDIDIDFEHERREEVIQYIYAKYGRERAALTAEVVTYRGRSAIREVGKALGLSLDCVDRLAKNADWWHESTADPDRIRELGLNPSDPTVVRLISLVKQLMGFPRHLSQHVGGFVITQEPLCEIVPIENAAMEDRTVIEWDKDDIDAMGMLKVDVLGLGMLTCVRKAIALINEHRPAMRRDVEASCSKHSHTESLGVHPRHPFGAFDRRRNLVLASLYDPTPTADHSVRTEETALPKTPSPRASTIIDHPWPLALHSIPPEDPAVYEMICQADTVGVFQIESRAQMSMLPRLRPRSFYDLVIEVAIVRPGPIQGNMVHPYLRRRDGLEAPAYPHEDLRRVLEKTLGVPLFQEQAMSLAIVAAGFSPGEADQLRRAMASWGVRGDKIASFEQRFINGMIERGYNKQFALQCFEQIKGFSGYGFPESHAASFALIVYASAWLKRRYPAVFTAALLNSQPMGFYAPAQLIRDAQEHGVVIRPIDVNHSLWDCTLEDQGQTLRLGMRLVKGLAQTDADAIANTVRLHGPIRSIKALFRLSGVKLKTLRCLALADAFGSMGIGRQQALWQVRSRHNESLPIFDHAGNNGCDASESNRSRLPSVPPLRQVSHDYSAVGFSLRNHPVSFIRPQLESMKATPNNHLKDPSRCPQGRFITVAGIVLNRQRPSTANGIIFMTLEDETGVANLIIRPDVYQRFRKAARHSAVIAASGIVERHGQVVHVLVRSIQALDLRGENLTTKSRDFH